MAIIGTPTVSSVFTKFTKDLQAVSSRNTAVAKATSKRQEELQTKFIDQEMIKGAANAEVSQAAKAIKNIGALLGISTGSDDDTGSKAA